MSTILEVAKGMVLLCDVINTTEAFNNIQKDSRNSTDYLVRISYLASRMLALGFTCCEAKLQMTGAKASTLMTVKQWEVASKVIGVVVRFFVEDSNSDRTQRGNFRVIEKTIASAEDLLRVIDEQNIYYEKHFLEMSPEELSKATRPVYTYYRSGTVETRTVEYKPINIEECKTNIAFYQIDSKDASFLRALLEAEAPSTIIYTGKNLYQHLANFFRSQVRNEVEEQQPLEEIDLIALTAIPILLHNDPVFSKYSCPITGLPIRNPVGDPNGITLYEKSAILQWLRIRNVSPVTNRPLFPNQLVPKPNIKALIDHRLTFHQQRLVTYMNSPST